MQMFEYFDYSDFKNFEKDFLEIEDRNHREKIIRCIHLFEISKILIKGGDEKLGKETEKLAKYMEAFCSDYVSYYIPTKQNKKIHNRKYKKYSTQLNKIKGAFELNNLSSIDFKNMLLNSGMSMDNIRKSKCGSKNIDLFIPNKNMSIEECITFTEIFKKWKKQLGQENFEFLIDTFEKNSKIR